MSRLTIVEGNSNDKDNVRAIMVKGEKGEKGDNGEITYSDVVDNLTSTETQKPLSANQGKVLKDLIDANKDEIDEKLNDKVNFIFPKFTSNEWSGDGNLIKYGDINILIDTNASVNWSALKNLLDDNNAIHIDYLIISHYDTDHIGNIDNLINNDYIDSNTQVFLPIVPSQFTSILTIESTVKSTLDTNNITYRTPTEKEQITINDNLKITFGNLNQTYMEANYTQYNATSMVCLIEHENIRAFYSGDAFQQTFKYLYDTNFIDTTIDLYKQAHHGIDTTNNFLLLDEIMSPRHTIQCGGIKDLAKNNFFSAETSFLINQGTLYYPTYIQTDYINFVSNGYVLDCLCGKTSSYSGQKTNMDLYVDINASVNVIQNGTSEHPFSELMNAIGYIKNFPSGDYTIHLADGSYGYSHEGGVTHHKNVITISPNNNINITIDGNSSDRTAVVLHQVRCQNANVRLQNLTVDLKDSDAIGLDNSFMYLNNVLITPSDSTQTTHTGIIAMYGSTVYIENSKIEYANQGISVKHFSKLGYSNLEFDNITYNNILMTSGEGTTKNILSAGTDDTTITLTDSYKQFDYIIVKYRTNDGIGNSINIPAPTDNYRVGLFVPYINSSGVAYNKSCILKLVNGNQIELSSQYQTTINNGSVSISAQTKVFYIQEVWAGYNV